MKAEAENIRTVKVNLTLQPNDIPVFLAILHAARGCRSTTVEKFIEQASIEADARDIHENIPTICDTLGEALRPLLGKGGE